jgi:hypothetical protein
MKISLYTTALITALILASGGLASSQEVHFLWTDTHNEVLARHNSALYTTVNDPPAAVDWRFNRFDAQQSMQKLYPRDRVIVQDTEVLNSKAVAEVKPETMVVNGKEVLLENW